MLRINAIIMLLTLVFDGGVGLAAGGKAAKGAAQSPSPQGLMNKLLAPGPLMEGHKELEQTDCLSCHAAGAGVPDSKCLDCHKDIKQSMAKPRSFHKQTKQPCYACHSDHQGRDFNAVAFDEEAFDHAKTGFSLRAKHADIKCVECHQEKRRGKKVRQDETEFFGTATTCVSCHKKDDPHAFTGKWAKLDCNSCHSDASWKKPISFDHEKDAHWELKGKHASTPCVDCHKQDLARSTPAKKAFHWTDLEPVCTTCHADYHGFDGLKSRRLGPLKECQSCHKERSWKDQISFDHNTQTLYKLDGKHLDVRCNDCHKPLTGAGAATAGAPNPATSKDQAGGPLRKYHWDNLAAKTCAACHTSPHIGKFPPKLLAKACTECHVTSSWNDLARLDKGKFDHNTLTKFALTGKHTDVACKDCHVKNGKEVYKFPTGDKQFCSSCHASVHKEQFSPRFNDASCADCHGTRNFSKLLPFDHNKTRFKLDGDHVRQTCSACHIPTQKLLPVPRPRPAGKYVFEHPQAGFCSDCHKNVHIGQFHTEFAEKSCRECHNTDTFTKRKPFDHHTASYDIKGKHIGVACEKCHTPTKAVFPPPSRHVKEKFIFPELAQRNCATCHPDVHKGKFGARCMECHNEAHAWASIDSFHKNFTLTGVHNLLACDECHIKDRKLTGLNERCEFCHRKDDPHNGGLPECGTCHNQQTWVANTFHHSMTDFPLIGAHHVAECNACHKNGIYQGTPTDCASCHQQDVRAVTFPNHRLPGFEDCGRCHNQFSFRGAKGG